MRMANCQQRIKSGVEILPASCNVEFLTNILHCADTIILELEKQYYESSDNYFKSSFHDPLSYNSRTRNQLKEAR